MDDISPKDCSILNSRTLRAIKKRSLPPQKDRSLEAERAALKSRHDSTAQLTSEWPNTILRNRIDRQTRLQKEKEAEEFRKIAIDDEEKKIRKLKKEADLAEARKTGFANRPEVRAVNAQLLLQEVQIERQAQQTFTESRKIDEMKRQIIEDQKYKQQYEDMVEKENAIRKQRKERAIEIAQGFRKQKIEKEQLKYEQLEHELADDAVFCEQTRLLLERDHEQSLEAKRRNLQFAKQCQLESQEMNEYKHRNDSIDLVEDARIQEIQLKEQEEQINRRARELAKKEELFRSREGLYEAAAKRNAEINATQNEFFDKQVREKEERDAAKVIAEKEKSERVAAERRQDFLDTQNFKKKDKTSYTKKIFNLGEDDINETAKQNRYDIRLQNVKDLAEFQLQQTREKKAREAAEKERKKLEFQRDVELDQRKLQVAQEYAKQKLLDNQV